MALINVSLSCKSLCLHITADVSKISKSVQGDIKYQILPRFTVMKFLHIFEILFLRCFHLSCEMKSHESLTR